MTAVYFPNVKQIRYEGPDSTNRLAFKHYNPEEKVGERTMAEHLRFAVAYWHTLTSLGSDKFGEATMKRAYLDAEDAGQMARQRLDCAFEFFAKLGAPFFCFHDTDLAPEADTLGDSLKRLDELVALTKQKMDQTGVRVLFGSQNLFENRRFMAGAYTNPSPEVFAWAAAKAKKMIEVCHELGAEGQAFWGGRGGYETILNTDLAQELDQQGRFFQMVVDYKKKIGATHAIYIEPKPREPLKKQYDYNVEAVHAFVQRYGLDGEVKVNLEANHASLAGISFIEQIKYAYANDLFGSLDANRGDPLLGWDTDQFPTDLYETTMVMHEVLRHGGFTTGGLNFDSKLRRQSIDPVDLFHAHIGAMDAYARGLKAAHRLLEDGTLSGFIDERYAGWKGAFGQRIMSGALGFEELQKHALEHGEPELQSGRQEMLENLINEAILRS